MSHWMTINKHNENYTPEDNKADHIPIHRTYASACKAFQ